ncbi:hypothetical protein BH23PLA1_BH23PLA1_23190 [soil metagenome]
MENSTQPLPFREVLEAADRLSPEEQAELAAILQRRLLERGRKQLAEDIQEARQEHAGGGSQPTTPDELMGEILA